MKIEKQAAAGILENVMKKQIRAYELLGKIYSALRLVEINCEKDEFLSTAVKGIREEIERFYENEFKSSLGLVEDLLEKDKNS